MKKIKNKELDLLMGKFYNEESVDYDENGELIDVLVSDGHLELRSSMNGSAYFITDKGKGFYLLGGYRKMESSKVSRYIRDLVVAVISSIITSLIQAAL